MSESDEQRIAPFMCSKCGFEISSDEPTLLCGNYSSHLESRCRELLKSELRAKDAESVKLKKQIGSLFLDKEEWKAQAEEQSALPPNMTPERLEELADAVPNGEYHQELHAQEIRILLREWAAWLRAKQEGSAK